MTGPLVLLIVAGWAGLAVWVWVCLDQLAAPLDREDEGRG